MRKIIIATLAFFLLANIQHAQQRITGGRAIDITEAPWQVLLQYGNDYTCGGIIIAPNIILTANHCTNNVSASNLKVIAGVTCKRNVTTNNIYSVSRIIKHPSIDVALLILSKDIPFDNSKQAIDFISSTNTDLYAVGNSVSVSGWGWQTPNGEDPSNCLNGVDVNIISNQTAAIALEFPVFDHEVATTGVGTVRQGACHGDSGGPLVIWSNTLNRHVLLGIVSRGTEGCVGNNTTSPSLYVRASSIVNWIIDNTADISGSRVIPCSGTTTYTATFLPDSWTVSGGAKIVSGQGTNRLTVNPYNTSGSPRSAIIKANYPHRTITKDVYIGSEPLTTIIGSTFAFVNSLTNFTVSPTSSENTYRWMTSGTIIGSGTGSSCTIVFNSAGNHMVSCSSTTPCSSMEQMFPIISVNVSSPGSGYKLFQEDNSRFITITLDEEVQSEYEKSGILNYTLTNIMSGIIVANGKLPSLGGTLDFSEITAGIYILQLNNNQNISKSFKIILK